jgi:hypothetical protein
MPGTAAVRRRQVAPVRLEEEDGRFVHNPLPLFHFQLRPFPLS